MLPKLAAFTLTTAVFLLGQTAPETAPAKRGPADTASDAANAECVERVQVPDYPRLARSVRIGGSVKAVVTLGPDGAVGTVATSTRVTGDSQGRGVLIAPAVEYALRHSLFVKTCANKLVTLVFNFSITGDPNDPHQQEMAYGYPNRFWITARPLPVEVLGAP